MLTLAAVVCFGLGLFFLGAALICLSEVKGGLTMASAAATWIALGCAFLRGDRTK